MNAVRILFYHIQVAVLLTAAASCTHHLPPSPVFPALSDSLSIEQSCALVSSHLASIVGNTDTAFQGRFYRVLDSTGNALARSLGKNKKSLSAVDSVIRIVYGTWGIGFDKRDMALESLLPHLVYKTGNGACLGVSLIILMLAEKIKCPLYGVMVPGHFFCRFEDGTVRFNIEPNKAGFCHSDDYYAERYPVGAMSWYDLQHNLSKKETIGVLCYNAGAICLDLKQYDAAIFYCNQATRRLNGFPEAQGNCALAYAQRGTLDSAMAIFKELFSSHPNFVNCAANYGSVLMASGKIKTAHEVFKKGLEYFPQDTVLKRGFEKSQATKSPLDLGG